jgi:diguanylate cyclase (GGDEF)-like protein/PAS domain S-box-containing protein
MGIEFTPHERSALYALLADSTDDIVVRTDRDGFIDHATPAAEAIGLDPAALLIPPHVADLAEPGYAAVLRAAVERAVSGRPAREWIEFCAAGAANRWFEASFRSLMDGSGQIYGALGVFRSIAERKTLEERLFAAEMTDVQTGLTNRRAFTLMLQHLVDRQACGCLALFEVAGMKAINLRYGHTAGDALLVELSALLRAVLRSEDIVSRIGGQTFAALLPHASPAEAGELGQRVVDALREIGAPSADLALDVSGGVAPIAGSFDETIRRAELATVLARAKGGSRVECDPVRIGGGSKQYLNRRS